MSKRLFKTMVAVLAIAAAAAGPVRGQNETLLTTVTATGMSTYIQSPDGVVTVVISGIDSYLANWGWYRSDDGTGTFTVTAAEGYTITRCVFKQNPSSCPNRVLEDDQAPFVMTINGVGADIGSSFVEASDGQRNGPSDDIGTMDGASVIEVYGYKIPTPHTVRFAAGNDGWSVKAVSATTHEASAAVTAPNILENVFAGDGLVATYNGTTKKVKSVKAVKYVAPAATVTAAPTATGAVIEVGSTAALVNAGAASGGTMMYAVTATNAQPASTADFSATVPTAEGRAAGTYYVWYYAKADAEHSDGEIAGPVSVTLAVMTTVTWNSTNVFNSDHWMDELSQWNPNPLTYEGITISFSGERVSSFYPYDGAEQRGSLKCFGDEGDSFTFTAPNGMKFCKIEIINNGGITFDEYSDEYGNWTQPAYNKAVWSGTAASTVTLGTVYTVALDLNSIVFKLIDAQ